MTKKIRIVRITDDEGEKYSLVSEKEIVYGNLCDTYSSYGQSLDCNDAGCYSIENSWSDFREDLLSYLAESLRDNSLQTWEYEWDFEKELREYLQEKHGEKGVSLLEKFLKEETVHTEAVYTTWWDGHNWRSKLWEVYDGEYSDGKLLDEDDEVAREILEAWEKCGGIGYIPKVSKCVFTLHNGKGFLFCDDRYPGYQIADCRILQPGAPVVVDTRDGKKKIEKPFWVSDMSFFFEEDGKIYLAEGYFTPEGEIYSIYQTDSLE